MRERKAAVDRTRVFINDDVGNVTEIMEMADCPGDLVLTNHTVMDGEEIFESCAALEAGPAMSTEAAAQSGGGGAGCFDVPATLHDHVFPAFTSWYPGFLGRLDKRRSLSWRFSSSGFADFGG